MNRLQMALLVVIKFKSAATFEEIFKGAEIKMSARLVRSNIQNALDLLVKRNYISSYEHEYGILKKAIVVKYKLESRGQMQCRGASG